MTGPSPSGQGAAASGSSAAPAFGRAERSNCGREQIHLAASIQPHGALLALREPGLTVLQASANAAAFLGLDQTPVGGNPAEAARRIKRSWRGEVRLADGQGAGLGGRPVLVRADPVFSAPDRLLGYAFLFNDLAERKKADAARRRFQLGIEAGSRRRSGRPDRQADLTVQAILAFGGGECPACGAGDRRWRRCGADAGITGTGPRPRRPRCRGAGDADLARRFAVAPGCGVSP